MAGYAGSIRVKAEIGTAKANKDLKGFSGNLKGVSADAGAIGKAVVGSFAMITAVIGTVIAAAKGLKMVVDISDELASTEARIAQMNDGLQTTDELMDMIFQAAQNARGSYQGMADVVARFGNNARDAFDSAKEVVDFSELIQKQMTIAGAGPQEAANAMLQLSQALGSGVLRGDELNSIFEQAPNLIMTIADYLGVSVGEIRSMAADGKITADVVKKAMFSAADDINEQFETMPRTWGQAWTSFKNEALMAFDPVLDALNNLANSEAFQTLERAAVSALTAIGNGLAWIINLVAQIDKDNVLGLQDTGGDAAEAGAKQWAQYGKSMDGVTAAAKKAKGALAAFDDIDVLQQVQAQGQEQSGGTPSGAADAEAVKETVKETGDIAAEAAGKLAPVIEKAKESIAPFAEELDRRFGGHIQSMGQRLATFGGDVATFFAGIGEPAAELGATIAGAVGGMAADAAELAVKAADDTMGLLLDPIHENIDGITDSAAHDLENINTVAQGAAEAVDGIGQKSNDVYDQDVHPFMENLTGKLSDLVGLLLDLKAKYLDPIADFLAGEFSDCFSEHVGPAVESVIGFIGSLVRVIGGLIDVIAPFASFILSAVVPALGALAGIIMESVCLAINTLMDTINGAFKILEAFFDGIAKGLEWIGAQLDGLGKVDFWGAAGGALSGLFGGGGQKETRAPRIPAYANGAVIAGGNPHLAWLGDQPAGQTNVETPLSTMVEAFREALDSYGGGRRDVVLEVNGREFARATIDDFEDEKNRRG